MQPEQRAAGSGRVRALLPVIAASFVAIIFLGWRYHEARARAANIAFELRVEGERVSHGNITLNGSEYRSGVACGVGSKTLRIEVPDAEPFQTNLFVWYRGASLGIIDLMRSKGTLALDVAPSPNTVTIRGAPVTQNITNCERQVIEFPTGEYDVTSKFEHFSVSRRVAVTRNGTTPVIIKPSVGTLDLASEPRASEFQLDSIRPGGVSIKGRTPTMLSALPTGKYEFTIWQEGYRKAIPVTVNSDSTNRVTVVFDYAKLTLKSQPSGADIRNDETSLGITPATLSFAPGAYRLSVGKSGYYATNFAIKVTGKESHEINVTLLNVAYTEAMQRARSNISGGSANYDRALEEVVKALEIQPDDADATALRKTIHFRRHFGDAQQLAHKSQYENALNAVDSALAIYSSDKDALRLKGEIEAAQKKNEQALAAEAAERRKKRPQEAFKEAAARLDHNELFTMQSLHLKGDADKVREAIVRSLGGRPVWNINLNRSTETNIFMVSADMKSLINKQRALFVIGQTTDGDVDVYYKVWEYVLGNNVQISLSGVSDDSWRPLHPNYVQGDVRLTQNRIARTLKNLRDKIEAELR